MRIRHEELVLGPAVASGSQGTIYRVQRSPHPGFTFQLIYKEFAAKTAVSGAALEMTAAFRERMDDSERQVIDTRTVWPVAAVTRGTTVCGYLMQAIPDSYMQTILTMTGSEPIAREVQHLFVSDEISVRNLGEVPTRTERLVLAREMAYALGFLHKRHVIFGDLSYKNAVYTLRPSPMIMLLDCDAVRFKGQGSAVAQLNSPGWGAPEKGPQTIETDRYKLGLFIMRCLTPGVNAQNRDPAKASSVLDRDGMALLRRSLDGDPAERPTGKDWVQYLDPLIADSGGVPTRTRPAAAPARPPTLARPGQVYGATSRSAPKPSTAPPPRRRSVRAGASTYQAPPARPLSSSAMNKQVFTTWVRPRRLSPSSVQGPPPRIGAFGRPIYPPGHRPPGSSTLSVPVIVFIVVWIIAIMIFFYVVATVVTSPSSPVPPRPTFVSTTTTTRQTTPPTSTRRPTTSAFGPAPVPIS